MRQSRERTAQQLFDHLESVALAAEGKDDPSEPTARCINGTKKRQLVTGSGHPRLRCCVCLIHHKCATKSPAAAREFFKTVLQQVCHFKVDAIAGDGSAAAYRYYKNQEYQDLCNSSVAVMLRVMQREVNTGQPFENRLHIDYSSSTHSSPPRSTQQMILTVDFMAILSWRKPVEPRIMRKHVCNFSRVRSSRLAKGGGPTELSNCRGRQGPHDGTSRL